jgi:hypothetical protein
MLNFSAPWFRTMTFCLPELAALKAPTFTEVPSPISISDESFSRRMPRDFGRVTM